VPGWSIAVCSSWLGGGGVPSLSVRCSRLDTRRKELPERLAMIAPIKKTQTARGSSSHVRSKPLRVCVARGGAEAGGLWVGEGGGDVDGEAGAGVVGTGVVAVGESGNC